MRECLLIDYRDVGGLSTKETRSRFEGRLARAREVAAEAEVELIPIATNIRHLDTDGGFWMYQFHGAVLAAVAHCFSERFDRCYIAATKNAGRLAPWGSHPLLDPYYSTAHLVIDHGGFHMKRFEKTALIADWPVGLQNIQVCVSKSSGGNNCGGCEKCLRTMTALLALGKLNSCRAFPGNDVLPEQLYNISASYYRAASHHWFDMVPALQAMDRMDLVNAIQELCGDTSHAPDDMIG